MNTTKRAGFTLIELMITTLLIGIMLAIAIPSFMSYQARARRSEAFANLQALARAQTTYKAERDSYFGTDNTYPDFTAQNNNVLGTQKMEWNAEAQNNFADIGWYPEGRVFYSYEVNTEANASCSCADCFTASAFGDVDGNGIASAVMFVHVGTDPLLDICPANLIAFNTPTDLLTGAAVYEQVAINRSADEY